MFAELKSKMYPMMFKSNTHQRPTYYDQHEACTRKAIHSLERAAALQRSALDLNDSANYTIKEKLKMFSVYHSNAIAGNQLSLQDTVLFLQDDIINEKKSVLDHLDALGHAAAIGLVGSTLRQGEKVDQTFVCEVNDLLTKHVASASPITTERSTSGIYKQSAELANGKVHTTIDPEQVPMEMEELFEFCDRSPAHPIVKATIAHFNFIRIHPFQHGNGRGARILMNLILQHHHLPPAVIKVEDKDIYLDCLHRAENGDIVPFIKFVASSLAETFKLVEDSCEDENVRMTEAQENS